MRNPVWKKAVAACADPRRAQQFLDQLDATPAREGLRRATEEQAEALAALLGGSDALSVLLVAHPDWTDGLLDFESLRNPRSMQGLRREVRRWLGPAIEAGEFSPAFDKLRLFKQRELMRIGIRDLARLDTVSGITLELSNLADVCLDAVLQICWRQLSVRLGSPYHEDDQGQWQPSRFCVLGMGKLGGQELNYSSDVDLLFVYTEEGFAFKDPPREGSVSGKGLTSHQFFNRLAEAFIAEVSRLGPEGTLYRIDMRLRPEGDLGPLVRSLAGYENYYAQWGQTWERMMLIKARCTAGDATLAGEFVEMIQPFRYPRSLRHTVLGEIAAMKERIENEVVRAGELDRNVKLGRGGIREIEFIAQSRQLLHAGRLPFLQGGQTVDTLQKLVRYQLLKPEESLDLRGAYDFLRDIEHRLQMENNLQTHTIPTDRKARERLARLMGFSALREFEGALKKRTGRVREIYECLIPAGEAVKSVQDGGLPRDFEADDQAWRALLDRHSFRDPEKGRRLFQKLVHGPGFTHVSSRTLELGTQLVSRLLSYCPKKGTGLDSAAGPGKALSDPDRVLARLDSYINAYRSRAMLYETWTTQPAIFELLVLLFDRSEFLAEIAIRSPDLVDELEQSGRLRRSKSAAEIYADLAHGREDRDQHQWLRQYHQAELMRMGLRDILGLADFEQNLLELTALADACLQYALEQVMRRHRMTSAHFAVIGLGKLGGREIAYGSDLDIVFVAEPKAKNLPAFQKQATEIMDLLSAQTAAGVVFKTDARLRPDGEKGLLVNTLTAFEEYYRQRAELWEIQAISRSRAVAGNMDLGRQFEELAGRLCDFQSPANAIAAWSTDWKVKIARMRDRIEKERTPAGKERLAIKTGSGGLVDAEFMAQMWCLAHGWREPNTLAALRRGCAAGLLSKAVGDALIENYRRLRRIEGILRRWSFEGEVLLPDDPEPTYRVAVRCGLPDAAALIRHVEECRARIREAYQLAFA